MPGIKPSRLTHRKLIPPKVYTCKQGHPWQRVLVTPVKGRNRLEWMCACTLAPLDRK